MEAVGRLAGGVAHDFNNLLTAITGYSALVERGLPPADPLRKDVQEIEKAAERAGALTRQLLAFGRKQLFELQILDLNRMIRDMGRMLHLLVGDSVHLDIRLASDLDPIRADQGQLEQVVTNLAVNANDSMPEGGRLTLATANLVLRHPLVREGVDLAPGCYVTLKVTDTGEGMLEETRQRIFEPFFTTKAEGTGLGLSTVYGIVKQSNGEILVESAPGRGTTFTVYFPRAEGSPETIEEKKTEPALLGSETVLLVEDQHAVRPLLRRLLEDAGFHVIEASNGVEALVRSREHEGNVDILVTDVVMPGMSGPELAVQLRRVNPGLKTLLVSGYAQEVIEDQSPLEAGTAFLQKPFKPDLLVQKVRAVLEGEVRERPSPD
jgi:CheY-like chemotaxis protein